MREMDEWWSKRTVEEVLGERVVGHELGDEQALVPVAAVADQVGHPAVSQLADPLGLLLRVKTGLLLQRIPPRIGVIEPEPAPRRTANCLASGQAILVNFLTAIARRVASRRPLYTKFGALSPLSETMFSGAKPPVAARSSSSENSLTAGTSRPAAAAEGARAWSWFSEREGRCGGSAPATLPGGFFSGSVTVRSEERQQPIGGGLSRGRVGVGSPAVCGVGFRFPWLAE